MPLRTDLEILADNITALDNRTRRQGSTPNLRLAEASGLIANPADYFQFLLNDADGNIYRWNQGLQQWDGITTGPISTTNELTWNHNWNNNSQITRNIAMFPSGGPYTVSNGRVAISAANVNRDYNFMLVSQETGLPANIEWSFNTLLDMTSDGGTLFIDVPLNFTISSNTRMFLQGFKVAGNNFSQGRFYVSLEYS